VVLILTLIGRGGYRLLDMAQMKSLHDLKVAGALSEEELSTQKARLLASGNG